MIRVRDDDVLNKSSGMGDEFKKLQMVHEWICEVPDTLIHVPAILVTEIQAFPEAIEFIRQETAEGRMIPEVHGLEHKDYANLTSSEIVLELEECKEWIFKNLGHKATKFYTPWGAGADERGKHIKGAASAAGLEMVTCKGINKLNGRYGVVQEMKNGRDIHYLDGREIFLHWWENMTRLRRVVDMIKYGSWEEAAKSSKYKKIFRE
jgi:peptidoglycan/xylan/chitin deacetylase (PgdA/CDA1 family)